MDQIKKENILSALKEIDEQGIRPGRHSSTYDLIYGDKLYPPKLVISIANRYATGEELDPSTFAGGEGTPAFELLRKFDFIIEPKQNNVSKYTWVQTHKELVEYLVTQENNQQGLLELLYSVGVAKETDIDEQDNRFPLTEIDPFTFFCFIYKHGPVKRLQYLKDIAGKLNLPTIPQDELGIPSTNAQKVWLFPFEYNRKNNEIKRLWDFFHAVVSDSVTNEQFADVLQIMNVGKIKITETLFYVNPEKYFPINGPTTPFLKEVYGIDTKFNSFTEYQKILSELREKTDKPFYQLSYEAWQWNDKRKKQSYWIFQGSPKIYDSISALNANAVKTWTVSAHRDKIKPGDKFILWLTGVNAGCYALGRVDSEVIQMKEEDVEMSYYVTPEDSIEAYRVKVIIEHQFVDHPVLWEMMKEEEVFKDFKGGNQGTNFSATTDEYHTLLQMGNSTTSKRYWLYSPGEKANKWEDFYSAGIMAMSWDKLGDISTYKSKEELNLKLREIEKTTSDKKNDAAANYEFAHVMRPGDIVIAKKGRKEYIGYGIISSEITFDDSLTEYKNYRMVNWKKKGKWPTEKDDRIVLKTLTDITKYPDYVKKLIKLLGIEEETKLKKAFETMKFPLNQILYGPPGTGKTYNTVLEAAKIVTGNNDISYDAALEVFKVNLDNQIEFITFHQNYSYEDFIQGLRPDTENGAALTFEKKDGVFKRIADRAYKNLMASKNPASAKKDFDLVFQELIQPLNDGDVTEVEIKMKKSSFFITAVGEKSIDFRKNIGDSEHTLSINILRKMYDKGMNDIILGGLQPYYNPILEFLLEKGRSQVTPIHLKNYVIIIDEINRANISRVFGELITLIEDDKRSHGKIPMRVTLPSGDSFIVPSNLHIIGTMNTADKSIALLDIALRRRFEFVPKYPVYEGLEQIVNDTDKLKKINEAIVSRKNHDFTIGHAYFMGDDYNLEKTINHKVIPLLLEYFMNTEKEVIDILKEAGITIGGWPLKMLP